MSLIGQKILVQTEHQNLLRDVDSKGLINKNKSELESYKNRKNFLQRIKEEDVIKEEKIKKLENEIGEIKNLLIELLKKEK